MYTGRYKIMVLQEVRVIEGIVIPLDFVLDEPILYGNKRELTERLMTAEGFKEFKIPDYLFAEKFKLIEI